MGERLQSEGHQGDLVASIESVRIALRRTFETRSSDVGRESPPGEHGIEKRLTNNAEFTISERMTGDVRFISVSGEIDLLTAPQLRDMLLSPDGMHPYVVVDLTNVSFVDSTGLSVLIVGFKQRRQHGGDLRLAGLPPQAQRVLEVTGLTQMFSIYENIDDAKSWSPASDGQL